MDLVAGVRKEGSRGGRDAFKWTDVKDSQHRENYLGHSLMAPVGRWQKGRDLSWYAKGESDDAEQSAKDERQEELRRIKEAEQEALAKALGFAPTPRALGAVTGANSVPIKDKEVERAIKEAAGTDEDAGGKGVGYGAYGERGDPLEQDEVIEGNGHAATVKTSRRKPTRAKSRSGSRGQDRRRRSRSGERDQKRDHDRHRDREYARHHRRRESRERADGSHDPQSHERNRRRLLRSRSRERTGFWPEARDRRRRSSSPARYGSKRRHREPSIYRSRR